MKTFNLYCSSSQLASFVVLFVGKSIPWVSPFKTWGGIVSLLKAGEAFQSSWISPFNTCGGLLKAGQLKDVVQLSIFDVELCLSYLVRVKTRRPICRNIFKINFTGSRG